MAVTSYNCTCDDATNNSTLLQLRTRLFDRLGFVDPLANTAARTLSELRDDLMSRLGYGAQMANPPPGMAFMLDSFANEAQQTLWRRLELDRGADALPARMVADSDTTTLDYVSVFNLALGLAKAHYGQPDAKVYFEINEKYLSDTAARRPPNVVAICSDFLQSAQTELYRRYDVLRTERFFSWPLTVDVRLYDLAANAEQTETEPCTKALDPRKVTWVGIERDGIWQPLKAGIPPALYSHDVTGRPERYEIRQCIEIWPVPEETNGSLVIKGRFGLEAFAADTDKTTIDSEMVFLLALANAKAHYRQPDANNYVAQLETMMQNLVAGSHQTRRYVPGHDDRGDMIYVQPRPTVPFT